MINQFESKLDTKLLDASFQKLASDFHCGNQYIDLFLRSAQALDDSFGKTYVWLNESEFVGLWIWTGKTVRKARIRIPDDTELRLRPD